MSKEIEVQTDGEKKYYKGLTHNYGRTPEYQFNGDKCVSGCKYYAHYETKHHKDCPFYKNSLSEKYDLITAAPPTPLTDEEIARYSLQDLKIMYEAGQDDCGEFGNVRGFEEMLRERLANRTASTAEQNR